MELAMDLKILGYPAPVQGQSVVIGGGSSNSSFAEAFASAYGGGDTGYDGYFEAAAARYQLPVNLLKAIGHHESRFQADAVSCCGAQGIMQLMPATARAMGVENAFDPAQNIMGGAKFLRQMLDRYDGNYSLALAAYSAGPGAVDKYGGIPPYSETQNYVKAVLKYAGADSSSAPVQSAAPVQETTVAPASQTEFLSAEELAGVIQTAFQSGGSLSQASVQGLLEQLLSQEGEEELHNLGATGTYSV